MQSLKISLGLRIKSKVNRVQNNMTIDNAPFYVISVQCKNVVSVQNLEMKVCKVCAAFVVSSIPIQQYKIKIQLHVNGLEALNTDIDGQVRIKGHLSAQCA